jgi:hypothetical protein
MRRPRLDRRPKLQPVNHADFGLAERAGVDLPTHGGLALTDLEDRMSAWQLSAPGSRGSM